MKQIVYRPSGETVRQMLLSDAPIRGIIGPVGSGKSSGMCIEGLRRSCQQEPGSDGKRRTRGLVIRNTYRELLDTTVKTWLEWLPEAQFGRFNYGDMTHYMAWPDGECEVLFRSMDKPEDIKKVLSLEITWAWLNEARELSRGVITAVRDRCGRYPSRKDGGPGATWNGVFFDTNQVDEDHWIADLQDNPPPGVEIYEQPGGLLVTDDGFLPNPLAENIENLPPNYYADRAATAGRDHAMLYYGNRRAFVVEGKPVIPEFNRATHVNDNVRVISGKAWVGVDIGGGTLNPAATIWQRTPRGVWMCHGDLVASGMGVEVFGRELLALLTEIVPDQLDAGRKRGRDHLEVIGDPAGADHDPVFAVTMFEHLRRIMGVTVSAAPTQDPKLRADALREPCKRLIDGKPGMAIHPRAKSLIKGLSGGWAFKRKQISGREAYHDVPDKGPYSHPCDSGGYALCAGGELRFMQGRNPDSRMSRPVVADTSFNVFGSAA